MSWSSELKYALWKQSVRIRKGSPQILLTHDGGLGDELLLTAVFHELKKRGVSPLWAMSHHAEIFQNNPDVDRVVFPRRGYIRYMEELGGRHFIPRYTVRDGANDADTPPKNHIIAEFCAAVGITGEIALRPSLFLTPEEQRYGALAKRQVVIQSSGASARSPMPNKEWFPERFQEVVTQLSPQFDFIQIGALADPPLIPALDLRGKTTIRQTAAILSNALCFVGLVGFPMHLARAVDCPAVIVYGGREQPWQSGYVCNKNLGSHLPCSPCWRYYTCDNDRLCMSSISAQNVSSSIIQMCHHLPNKPLLTEAYRILAVNG